MHLSLLVYTPLLMLFTLWFYIGHLSPIQGLTKYINVHNSKHFSNIKLNCLVL